MNVGETYNKGLDGIERFTNLLSSDKQRLVRIITNSISILIIMGVFGCFDFINWQFNFVKITTTEYWTHLMTRVVSGIASFNIGINFNWENAIRRATELKENIELYNILIKQKDDSNFSYFVNHVFNKKLKRRAYINKINRKIHRLDKFSRDRDRKLYDLVITESMTDSEKQSILNAKETNRYCKRRSELEYLKSEEYINRNLDSIGVRYPRVKPSSFNVEIDGKIRETEFVTEGNVGLGKFKASTGVALSMIVVSMALSFMSYSLNQEQFVDQMQAFWNFFINFVADVGLIIWRVFGGTRKAPKIVSEQLTQPYANRNTVLKEYIEWKETANLKPSKSFVKINELVDEENNVITLNKEQLELIKKITPEQIKSLQETTK